MNDSVEKGDHAYLVSDNDQMWEEYKAVIKQYTPDEFCEAPNKLSKEVSELTELAKIDDDEDLHWELHVNFGAMVAINKAWEQLWKEQIDDKK